MQLHSRHPALGWRLCEDPQLPALSFQSWETAEEGCSVAAGVARQKDLSGEQVDINALLAVTGIKGFFQYAGIVGERTF